MSKLLAVALAALIGVIAAFIIAAAVWLALAAAIAWGLVEIFWHVRGRFRPPAEQTSAGVWIDEWPTLERALKAHREALELGLPANDAQAVWQRELFGSRSVH